MSSLFKKPTCYQSHTPSCIDLILTNRKHLFQLSNTFETGLSDHHKLIWTILKSGGFKGAPIEKIYRSYKTFDVDQFQEILKIKLENIKSKHYGNFEAVFLKELNKHAPLKKKFWRHNLFITYYIIIYYVSLRWIYIIITKNLRMQIMVRSKLRNNYNIMRIGANTSTNAIFVWIFYKKQKRTSIKHLMKNKCLIAKPSGKI